MHRSDETNLEHFDTPRAFLDEVYSTLHYEDGALLDAVKLPDDYLKQEWVDKGDWLSLAAEIGAEKVFFVNNDPVLVFCTQENTDPHELLNLFRRYWCMARPQCLFLALPGELRVYSLNQDPAKNVETWQNIKPLDVVRRAADVAEVLQAYRREQVETGRLFHEKRFGDVGQRADKRLIQDLKIVRQALLATGLESRFAHAIIGRSIFIRYLEDRGVLTSTYFQEVAEQNPEWGEALWSKSDQIIISSGDGERWYERVLKNKAFTYALFQRLAEHFNGDMFPRDIQEENDVDQSHLDLLRGFLLGNANPEQPALFLWAYDFKIVPTDLISSIYEEFYHGTNAKDDKGTHYTPSVLVDHVLSQVLSERCLATNPRILDPACGSGIFLVEAFRRIVRYKIKQLGRQLNSGELRQILKEQLAGIEINTEAIHVTAFSLYLALLHYQTPPDILQNRLPRLIYRLDHGNDDYDYGILFNHNAFSLTNTEITELTSKLQNQPRFQGRSKLEQFLNESVYLPVTDRAFDIVVGNPPWGASKGIAVEVQGNWCKAFGWPSGDKEPSQAFIARSLTFLKPGGECGLLISTGVFLKHLPPNELFRMRWLDQCTLKTVVNFAHVRHIFFKNGDASFAFVHFKAEQPSPFHKVQYWSAKRTDMVDQLQAVILSLTDLNQVEQSLLQKNAYLWKTYWWGSHRDAALINALMLEANLGEFLEERLGIPASRVSHRGYKSGLDKPSSWLSEFRELPISLFRRYGPIDTNQLISAPKKVLHHGVRQIYEGWRILVKRNPSESEDSSGRLVARLENINYCFSSSIVGFPVSTATEWERKILIGILWSSVARYFLFLTSSGWGMYHGEVLQTELMSLPIRFPKESALGNQIVETVETLLEWKYSESSDFILSPSQVAFTALEKQLDNLIFELYQLSSAERELIEDMCSVGFELLYRKTSKLAVARVDNLPPNYQGTIGDLVVVPSATAALQNYLYTFLQIWNRELEPDGEFSWQIIRAAYAPMIAVIFKTQEKGQPILQQANDSVLDWNEVLERCANALRQPVSEHIYLDGMIRVVTDTEIYIVKRDERRLWTRSMAREDAEATRLQAMHLQQIETF